MGWAGGMSNQSLEGGQRGIELVQAVEKAGSGGLSWHRWWRWQAVGDQVGEFEVVDDGQWGIELAKVVGEFEVVDGGQWGIELVKVMGEFKVVEMVGSGGAGVGDGCNQGIQLKRWW